MTAETTTTPNVEIVERFLAAFGHRRPAEEEPRELLTEDVSFVEQPNLVNPRGSIREVVTRLRWTGELAVDAGPWPAGTRLAAWCVAHYRLREGRIGSIEQHDCYEQPARKEAG